jgi:hypothetical protein
MTRLSDEAASASTTSFAPVRMDGHFQEREEGACPTWGGGHSLRCSAGTAAWPLAHCPNLRKVSLLVTY